MRRPRFRSRKHTDLNSILTGVLNAILDDLRANPVTINHQVTRSLPPRPTQLSVLIRDNDGREWRSPPIDASFKHSVPFCFPLSWVTGFPADAGKQCSVQLDLLYDPQEGRRRY